MRKDKDENFNRSIGCYIENPLMYLQGEFHALRETDFRGHWRVDFRYLKIKPNAHISVQWALFLYI